MKKNSLYDFFSKKRPWSKIKDHLLSWYLTPYLAKVFSGARNFYLIDGFAGPGVFEDGEKGSPLIEKEIVEKTNLSTKNKNINFNLIFVERDKKLFERLKHNCGDTPWIKCYNESIERILRQILSQLEQNAFVFLYLDPFGINGLPTNLLDLISERKDLKIEILINFNSVGCYRECMRLLGSKQFDDYFSENEYIGDPDRSIGRMNSILGTSTWPNVARTKNAEYKLSLYFCDNLRKKYKYVLNMPVRDFNNEEIKYRMVHCSNNCDGAILMADNMISKAIFNKISLFSLDLEGNIVDVDSVIPKIMDFIPSTTEKPIRLNQLLLKFYEKIGIVCNSTKIKNYLKLKEKNNDLIIYRYPEKSPTGKTSEFWSEGNGKVVLIAKKMHL